MEIPIVKSLLKSISKDNCFATRCIHGIGELISIRGLSNVGKKEAGTSHHKETHSSHGLKLLPKLVSSCKGKSTLMYL